MKVYKNINKVELKEIAAGRSAQKLFSNMENPMPQCFYCSDCGTPLPPGEWNSEDGLCFSCRQKKHLEYQIA